MLKHASVIITIITASLYVLGLTFYQGFLAELNIEETLFPLSLHRTLFQGYVSVMHIGAESVLWLLLAAEGVLVVSAATNYIYKVAVRSNWFIIPSIEGNDGDEAIKRNDELSFHRFSRQMFISSATLFLVFVGMILIIVASTNAGTAAATKLKEKIENGKLPSVNLSLNNGVNPIEGYPVVCNQNQCVFYINGKSVIYNLNEIKVIEGNKK